MVSYCTTPPYLVGHPTPRPLLEKHHRITEKPAAQGVLQEAHGRRSSIFSTLATILRAFVPFMPAAASSRRFSVLLPARGSQCQRLLSRHPSTAPATGSLRNSSVVVEIVKAGQEAQDALTHQGAHLVHDQVPIARIVEARGLCARRDRAISQQGRRAGARHGR